MGTESYVIKSALLLLFKEGKSEDEAYEHISKSHDSYSVSLRLVKIWFKRFRKDERNLNNKRNPGTKKYLDDEFLIKLINENPGLNMTDLGKLAGTSRTTISARMKEINMNGNRINYNKKNSKKGTEKLTEEFLIKLIKENPGLNMEELAKLADTSHSSISVRLRQINSNRLDDNKIIIQKGVKKVRKSPKKISDDCLINLVNENPELNISMLAELAGLSARYVWSKLKKINNTEKLVDYNSKKSQKGTIKLTDESLIKLIEENSGLNTYGLAKIADTSQSTISVKIRKINSYRPADNKIILQKSADKIPRNKIYFTEEFIIKLINDNPELNLTELAELGQMSLSTLSTRLKSIKANGVKVNYTNKKASIRTKKLTEELLIKLINDNPGIDGKGLVKLSNSSLSTVYLKLRQINSTREEGDKIKLQKDTTKIRKSRKIISNEDLIKLVNENPDFNMKKLAELAGTSQVFISTRLKLINSTGEKVNYVYKR